MKKALAWGLGIVVGVPVALAGTAAIVVNTIDQQALLNSASEVVKTDFNRTLKFSGPVKLKWFPYIGAELEGVSLSEFSSDKSFLNAKQVKVSLAFMPLLSSQVVVDSVVADGVSVNLIKDKQGKFNFDDLAGGEAKPEEKTTEPSSGQSLNFSVADISLTNLQLTYADQASGLEALLNDFSIKTGRIEPGVPTNLALSGKVKANQPKADIAIDLKTGLEFGLGEAMYAKLAGLNASVKGEVDGQAANVELSADKLDLDPNKLALQAQALVAKVAGQLPGVGKVDATLSAPSLALTDTQASGKELKLTASLNQAGRDIQGDVTVTGLSGNLKQAVSANLAVNATVKEAGREVIASLATPLQAHVENQTVKLPALKGQVDITDPAIPKGKASLPIDATVDLNNKAQKLAATLKSSYESTPIDLQANVANFSNPFVQANLTAGKLDLDALFPPSKEAKQETTGGGNIDDIPVDISPLKTINVDVTAKVASLKVSDVVVSDINLRALSKGGALTISPFTAKLYQGTSAGTVVANANTNAFVIKQDLSNIQIEPFLRDVVKKDMAQGRGDVKVDLTTQGKTVGDLKRSLNGRLSVSLADGAIKGFNLGERLQSLKGLLTGGVSNETASTDASKSTQFSSLAISFDVKDGVARTDDLRVMAPLFRIGGKGVINLVDNSLDYTADASIVATSTGQGGKTLDAGLLGLTVPVKVYGGFASIQWKLLLAELAKAAIKNKVNVDTDQLKAQAQEKVDKTKEELKGKAEEKLKDAFKGFLSK